jgi:Uncharacterised protein family (UPF0236)
VGVVFWEDDHLSVSSTRKEVRRKEYVATMSKRTVFEELLLKRYSQVVKTEAVETLFLGDGAKWLWSMASTYFPEAIQILDFYHLSEYVWAVARASWPQDETSQKTWVSVQQKRLKASKWKEMLETLDLFEKPEPTLKAAIHDLKRYTRNNSTRIDYKHYLEQGYMIGSGVVESSNRRIVTQRLKGSGMYWSKEGANAIMALRSTYLSSSDRWKHLWSDDAA